MKKRHYISILIAIAILITSIYFNIDTITNAEKRIIFEKENTPISELITKEEQDAELVAELEKDTMVVKETNSYTKKELTIVTITPIISSICIVYLIFTSIGKLSIKETLTNKKRLTYGTLTLVLLCTIASTTNVIITDNKILNSKNTINRNEKPVAVLEITKDKKTSNIKEESTKNDTSVIQVSNQSKYTATNIELNKTNGISTDKEISEYFGLNSAAIIKDSSTLELNDSKISTNTEYSSAIFLTGLGTTATLNKVNLNTTNNYSHGISISEEANLTANDVELTTKGDNSSAIKTMDTNSSINLKDSLITTEGQNSPILYSNGNIETSNIEGTSLKSEIAIINGANNILIENSTLSTNASSAFKIYKEISRGSSNDYNLADLTIKKSKIIINKESNDYKTAPLFKVINTKAKINITNTTFKYGSNILLNITSEDEYNPSEVTMTVTDQYLKGNIVSDEFSKVRLNLNNSTYKGRINKGNISKNIDITFDENSKWILTGTSYVNTLTVTKKDLNNVRKYIRSNGYNIYYNVKNNEWLNGRTITLIGGGKLIPKYYKS